MLSDNIKANFGKDAKLTDYLDYVSEVGTSFVGVEFSSFLEYISDIAKLSMNNILENFKKHETSIMNLDRSRKTNLIEQLKEMNVVKFTKKKLNNLLLFLDCIHQDERVAYLRHLYNNLDIKYVDIDGKDFSKNIETLSEHFEVETKIIIEGKLPSSDETKTEES